MDFDLFTIGIIFVVAGLGLLWYFNRKSGLDVNQDGKVNVTDAKAAVANTVAGVEAAVDLNKDGKVNLVDAAIAVTEVKTVAKKAVTKTKAAVKKVAAKTPAAETVAVKKPGRKPKEA
jgi:tetrahydromethanopterin S-methyltransferase subunit C